jgi:hypothetical protein
MAMGIERLRKTTSERATIKEPSELALPYGVTRDQSQRLLSCSFPESPAAFCGKIFFMASRMATSALEDEE